MNQIFNLLLLPGDGIGPEVMEEAKKLLDLVASKSDYVFEYACADFGGASIDAHATPLTDEALKLAKSADAVLLGAVGGSKWDDLKGEERPESGLLKLRSALEVYANIRPARFYSGLGDGSPLRDSVSEGANLVIVRELTGGIYFGTPRGVSQNGTSGWNTMTYHDYEVRRIAKVAFEVAQNRKGELTSVDKANVLEVSRLWRDEVENLHGSYGDVKLNHLYVDNCAMQLVRAPKSFDVIVTSNLFGDILSDLAGAMTGSLGMLPSASVGEGNALYEPVHGSAPDIAGQGMANPIGMLLSVAMFFEHTVKDVTIARKIEEAVEVALGKGNRTRDIAVGFENETPVGTDEMGAAIRQAYLG